MRCFCNSFETVVARDKALCKSNNLCYTQRTQAFVKDFNMCMVTNLSEDLHDD